MATKKPEDPRELAYNDALRKRLAGRRVELRITQQQMADALGIPLERYKKYENRSPLPQYLFVSAAAILQLDVLFLLTGRHEKTRHQRRNLSAAE